MPETRSRSLLLADESATKRLGKRLGALVRAGDVIALDGGLGAGKSALARALIQSLAGDHEDVPSPTFTLVQTYPTAKGTIWHFDLFRLNRPEDALELGIEDAFEDGISLIEWPERLGRFLPADRLSLHLKPGAKESERRLEIVAGLPWDDRIASLGDD